VESASQFAPYWYGHDAGATATTAPGPWRPGLFVKALVKGARAEPVEAVSVPAGSLLYHDGHALVYVRVGDGRFERREVRVLGREDGGRWVLSAGVRDGEPVVSERAQVLLSEEFRGEADDD
jgi:multidrug efflux pump subunit AcrA (membrane-fusion protein)